MGQTTALLLHADELFMPEKTLSGNVRSAGALPHGASFWPLSLLSNSRLVDAEPDRNLEGWKQVMCLLEKLT